MCHSTRHFCRLRSASNFMKQFRCTSPPGLEYLFFRSSPSVWERIRRSLHHAHQARAYAERENLFVQILMFAPSHFTPARTVMGALCLLMQKPQRSFPEHDRAVPVRRNSSTRRGPPWLKNKYRAICLADSTAYLTHTVPLMCSVSSAKPNKKKLEASCGNGATSVALCGTSSILGKTLLASVSIRSAYQNFSRYFQASG